MSTTDPRNNITAFIVRPSKLSQYLLDPRHVRGGSKAAFFIAQGFSPAYPADLDHALRQHGRDGSLAGVRRDEFGLMFEIDGGVLTPRSSVMRIRSVWCIQDGSEDVAEFVTAFPKR